MGEAGRNPIHHLKEKLEHLKTSDFMWLGQNLQELDLPGIGDWINEFLLYMYMLSEIEIHECDLYIFILFIYLY